MGGMALDLNDKTSNSNTLTNHGATDVTTSLPFAGDTHAAAVASASTQYLSAANSTSLNPTNNITVEAWIKPTVQASYQEICSKDISGGRQWEFNISSDGTIGVNVFKTGGTNSFTASTGKVTANAWNHVAFTYLFVADGTSETRIYINGSADGTNLSSVGALASTTTEIDIGRRAFVGSEAYFDGQIDEVRVWNTTRTATEISNNYQSMLTGSESGLVAYWPFEVLVVNLNVNVFDSITVAETVTAQKNNLPNVFDSITVAETVTAQKTLMPQPFDSITIAETVTAREVFMPQPVDNITVAENITATSGPLFINIADNITIAESTTPQKVNNTGIVFDSITIAETVTPQLVNNTGTVFDSITTAETTTVREIFQPQVFDNITVAETTTSLIPSGNTNIFDSINISESTTPQLVNNISVVDNITIAEATTPQKVNNTGTIFDSITVAETETTQIAQNINVFDSITISESTILQIPYGQANVFDGITISENTILQEVNTISVFDSITVSENITSDVPADFDVVFDSITISESTIPQLVNTVNVFDSITVAETVIASKVLTINVFDSITVSESNTLVPGIIVFDNSSNSGYQASLSTYNWSHTASGNHLGVIVGVSIFAVGTVTSVTYGGVNLSFVRADVNGIYRSEIWELEGISQGTNTVVVNLSASVTSIAGAATYQNVDQVNEVITSYGSNGIGDPASVTGNTLEANSWTVDNISTKTTTISAAAGQRERVNNGGVLGTGGMSDKGTFLTPGNTTMSWSTIGTLDSWAQSVIILRPYGDIDMRPIDNIQVSETVIPTLISNISVFDNITISENVNISTVLNINVFDNIQVSESTVLQEIYNPNIFDSITISELVTVSEPYLVPSVEDDIQVSESTQAIVQASVVLVNVFDSITVADVIVEQDIFDINVEDDIQVSENITALIPLGQANISDNITVSESVFAQVTGFVSVIDNIQVSEAVNEAEYNLDVNVSDNINVSEYLDIIRAGARDLSIFDSIKVSEYKDVLRSGARDIFVFDVFGGAYFLIFVDGQPAIRLGNTQFYTRV